MTVAVVAVVLAAAGTGVWWFTGRDQASAATAAATTATVQASTTTMEKSVSASGTLTPTVQEDVSFQVGGTVTAVSVAAGDTVQVGQTLATVDTLQLDANLLDAKATLATAKAKLADLRAAGDGSDASDAQIAAASAQVDVAAAAVTSAQTAVGEATLVAPVAGLVTSVGVEVGNVVGGSSSAQSGAGTTGASGTVGSSTSSSSSTAQFVIVGTGAYQTTVSLADSDVALIATGDQVEMTSDSLSGTVFGVVSSIGLISTTTSGTAGYPVVVDVTGDVSALHDGVSVTAKIIYSRRTDVLTVPSAAITTASGASTVQKVAGDGTVTTTTVQVGETSGTLTEITSGLSAGDSVQVTTYARVSSGSSTRGTSGQQGGYGGQQGGYGGPMGGGELPAGGQLPAMPGSNG
jgi:macrolide-specific efflux system membrane fusion protein